jgi:peptidylprolyl isomerase
LGVTVQVWIAATGWGGKDIRVGLNTGLTFCVILSIKDSIMNQELIIEDILVGSGEGVKPYDKVTIHYTGTLESGKVFDSSVTRGEPFSCVIGVGQVIAGWDQGILDLKVGGKRKLTIPYQMAYGEAGYPPIIPGKSTLIFEVELLKIN